VTGDAVTGGCATGDGTAGDSAASGCVTGGGLTSKRYRPGRPFTFTSVWFVADGGGAKETEPTAHVVGPGSRVPALRPVAGRAPVAGEATGAGEPGGEAGGEPVSARRGPTGGASDRW
jgi:hypothetical protein